MEETNINDVLTETERQEQVFGTDAWEKLKQLAADNGWDLSNYKTAEGQPITENPDKLPPELIAKLAREMRRQVRIQEKYRNLVGKPFQQRVTDKTEETRNKEAKSKLKAAIRHNKRITGRKLTSLEVKSLSGMIYPEK